MNIKERELFEEYFLDELDEHVNSDYNKEDYRDLIMSFFNLTWDNLEDDFQHQIDQFLDEYVTTRAEVGEKYSQLIASSVPVEAADEQWYNWMFGADYALTFNLFNLLFKDVEFIVCCDCQNLSDKRLAIKLDDHLFVCDKCYNGNYSNCIVCGRTLCLNKLSDKCVCEECDF